MLAVIKKIVRYFSVFILAVVLTGVWYFRHKFTCGFYDGPFHGRVLFSMPSMNPIQTFHLDDSLILNVFQPSNETESPVVSLSHKDGTVKWIISADGYRLGDTRKVEFEKFHPSLFGGVTAQGTVTWAYGTENMWWSFSSDGSLKHYCYSW